MINAQIKIAIIVPCYNEEDNILALFHEIKNTSFPDFMDVVPVFVNDCSKDNSVNILRDHKINHLDLPVNLGIGGAVQTGFKYAFNNHFDIAVQMDGDGQHPPTELLKILEPIIKKEADVVVGSRFLTQEGFQSSYMRRVGINFFKWLNWKLVGAKINDSTSGYRALNRSALHVVNDYYPDEYPEPEAIILYQLSGLKIKEVQVNMRERQGGESSIRAYKTIYYMVKVTLSSLFLFIRLKLSKNTAG